MTDLHRKKRMLALFLVILEVKNTKSEPLLTHFLKKRVHVQIGISYSLKTTERIHYKVNQCTHARPRNHLVSANSRRKGFHRFHKPKALTYSLNLVELAYRRQLKSNGEREFPLSYLAHNKTSSPPCFDCSSGSWQAKPQRVRVQTRFSISTYG